MVSGGGARAPRARYVLLLAAVSAGSYLLLTTSSAYPPAPPAAPPASPAPPAAPSASVAPAPRPLDPARYTIDTPGCAIPGLQPFDEAVRKFVEPPAITLQRCPAAARPLLARNATHVWVQRERLAPREPLACCYRAFYRPSAIADIDASNVDDRVKYEPCVHFDDVIKAADEFVRVTCRASDVQLHDQFFLFAQQKPLPSERTASTEAPRNDSAQNYNVIIMGIDAVSRLNFHRTMPKTLAYLQSKGAIELLGYNKVADNTFPNVIPLLLGVREAELNRTCWPNRRRSFDNCPFLWEWFAQAGYLTALGEDSALLGTFNSGKQGFSGTPTDYYLHTFVYEAETAVGNNFDFNSHLCMGDAYFYQVLLDYVEQLVLALKDSRLFGFFWEVTMSHDYLNYPMEMDRSYETFLQNLDAAGYLDETIMIFLSDHGIRWGDIRYTKQGRLEERLPLAHFLLPPSFRAAYPAAARNLEANRHHLTTPFDLHETLTDLLNMHSLTDEQVAARSRQPAGDPGRLSLFLPVPGDRTCRDAGIDEHWCTCNRDTPLPPDGREAVLAARQLVRQLNRLVKRHAGCARLRLSRVLAAREVRAGRADAGEAGWREFLAVVRTAPGDGVFEATLRNSSAGWALAGSVSRLNLYGDQSRCVSDDKLKLYCYCR